MKKIFLTCIIFFFAFSFTTYSVEKNKNLQNIQKKQSKEDKFFKKCADECMSKKTRCIKEGNKEKSGIKMLHTRSYCDNNYKNCIFDCQTRYGKKR
jgi:hypothetical protein